MALLTPQFTQDQSFPASYLRKQQDAVVGVGILNPDDFAVTPHSWF